MISKVGRILLAASLLSVSYLPNAQAHAQLVDANPKANARLQSLPERVRLEFDGNLITIGDSQANVILVKDSKGNQIDLGDSVVGGARLTVILKSQQVVGRISVAYRVVSEDGHPIEGDYYFTVLGSVAASVPTKITITCIKSKKKLKITGVNPKCSSGWKKL